MLRSTALALVLSVVSASAFAEVAAPAPTTSAQVAVSVKLLAAGSLKGVLGQVAADYEKSHPVKVEPTWGPSGLLLKKMEGGEAFDIFASASLKHAVTLTDEGLSGPSVMFVRNTLCAMVLKDSPITTENLVGTLLKPDVKIGTSTPGSDPSGDYTWEVFRLIDKARPGAFEILSAKADKIVGNAIPDAGPKTSSRSTYAAALDDKKIDVAISYCSFGKGLEMSEPGRYRTVSLPKDLEVGAEYGLTVSAKASPAAASFAMYILSPAGQQRLAEYGFLPVALPAGR